MIVGVVGAGAREHAIASVLARNADVVVTPGNPGMSMSINGCQPVRCTDVAPEDLAVDLMVIGPEAPLVDGLADRLRAKGVPVFGPGRDGARLEGSKAFMKDVAARAGVPSARYGVFDEPTTADAFCLTLDGGYVIKTDGLAAGKGVLVTKDLATAQEDIRRKLSGSAFGVAGRRVVIEEAMEGPEVSLLVLCTGEQAVALPAAQDFKRAFDGDRGPNTGGMGAYSPVPVASESVVGAIMDTIVLPTLRQLRIEGIDYRGVLYAGCMLTVEGPKLIEYNVRFGDPEAEVVLPRIETDLAELLLKVALGGTLEEPAISDDATVGVVMAARGYPGVVGRGERITGVEAAGAISGIQVFHAATDLDATGELVTAGGRVLCVTASGANLIDAREHVYKAVAEIAFDGAHYRRDIAEFATSAVEAVQRGA